MYLSVEICPLARREGVLHKDGGKAAEYYDGVDSMSLYEQAATLWQGWRVKTVADIDLRLHNFRILFAYNSGKIENAEITYHDTREIFENGRVLNFTGDPRSVFELENQKLCYEFLKHKIAAREQLTVPLVLEVHSIHERHI